MNLLREEVEEYAEENSRLRSELCNKDGYEALLNVRVTDGGTPRLLSVPLKHRSSSFKFLHRPISDTPTRLR